MTGSEQIGERDTHMSETPLNVYQRFRIACEYIDGLEFIKDMTNKQYSSVPIDAMRAAVRGACVKAGLIHKGPENIQFEKVKDGNTFRFSGSCTFTYINIDDPQDVLTFDSLGEAMDNGDKGTGKFLSNLIKNHYKAAFDIGEQGKDDVDSYENDEYYKKVAETVVATAAPTGNRQKNIEQAKKDPYFGGEFKTGLEIEKEQAAEKPKEESHEALKQPEEPPEQDPVTAGIIIPTEKEIENYINVLGQTDRFKDTVKNYKLEKGAKTAYELSFDQKVELFTILKKIQQGARE